MVYAKRWILLMVAALLAAGCAGSELKVRKDGAWSWVPQSLPDTSSLSTRDAPLAIFKRDISAPLAPAYDATIPAYGHPFRPLGFALYPFGTALDYALVQPFYFLAGLAPEWFGLTAEDSQRFQQHFPELVVPRDAPRRFE
jgi:hypothetical protein